MRGLSRDWSIPFNEAEIGRHGMFVWCQTKELAEEFIETYYPYDDKKTWIRFWDTHQDEHIYAVPHKGRGWMHGTRDSLDGYWTGEGYVPRLYLGETPVPLVEVGDLL